MEKYYYKFIDAQLIEYQLANLSQLTFEVTDACNLQCKYCGYGELYDNYDKRVNQNLPIQKAIRLIDYLVALWNSNINVSAKRNVYISFYGGEPLMNIKFIKAVIQHIEDIDCSRRSFTFSMTTNGILLDKYMDYLVEKDFNLLISLDGNAENDSYRVDHRQQPSFDRVVQNIDLLQSTHPQYFESKVNFNSVLHNKNSVEDIYTFFKEKYNKIPSIGEINDNGIRPDKQETFLRTYRNAQESLYQSEHYREIEKDMFIQSASYQSVCTFIHQYSGFVYSDYIELLFGKKEKKRVPTGTCLPFSKKMFVTAYGKILPCERIGSTYSLGQITETGIELDYAAIAQKYNKYYSNVEKQCSKCYNAKACTQCLFYLADLEDKPVCHGFMGEADFKEYYMNQMAFLSENPEDYYRIMEEVVVE